MNIHRRPGEQRMSPLTFRKAQRADLETIVALLASDPLGQSREDASIPLPAAYVSAFEAIDADPNQLLAVVIAGDKLIGTLQLTFLPNISRPVSYTHLTLPTTPYV